MRHSGQHVSSAVQHLVQCQHIFGPLRKHVESDRLVYSIELLRRKCIKVKQTYLFTRCEKFLVSNLLNIIVFQIAFVVRLFVWSFPSQSRMFHSFGDVTIAGEGLQISTYARHLRPLSSEGSLACHTYCDTL